MPDSGMGKARVDGSTVTLRAGASELAVAAAIGGSVAWYRTRAGSRTIDWLRPASPEALAAGDAGAMGCFPLVPFSNRIREGKFRFAGRGLQLPLNVPGQKHCEHGHGWQAPWRAIAHGQASLTIEYRHAADAWPFPYTAWQIFRLEPEWLTVEIAVKNTGSAPMPVGIGLHPYFPRTPRATLTAQVDRIWNTDDEVMPVGLADPPAQCRLDEGLRVDGVALDNGFTGWSRRAEIDWPENRARLIMTADQPLSFLVVYTPRGESFFCAEPVSNCTDAFNLADQGHTDTGMAVLAPGKTLRAAVAFTPSVS
jgi:aldose 1-epimerase